MFQEILNKYNVPVPRYTSYPSANFFNESFTAASYKEALIASNGQKPEHVSIYIHIPFCHQLCYYCGCNSQILRDKHTTSAYISALKKEIKTVLPLLNPHRKISQIHYGGGTPTLQPVSVLKELNELILSELDCIEKPEIAIECHPGYMNEQYWNDLITAGFNRVSIGIQDFNEEVLKISNRKPPLFPIDNVVKILKNNGISFNMDFIYGLPRQTPDSFTATIDKAISLHPDRIVTFSYAHVPWVNKLQQNLEKAGLPSVETKNQLFETAKECLTQAGYKPVGLDHFVLPDDELYIAQQTHRLHRNFQGYCTRRTTGQVYAFGITGISQLATAYSQNSKDLNTYIEKVNRGEFPVLKGYILNNEEQITREVVAALMCNYTVHWNEIAERMNTTKEAVIQALNYKEETLSGFAKDGIIHYDDNHITVLPEAAPLVRNVAASLDKLMLKSNHLYSKPV
jgi:oxygen-independent coproporphyrinogen-3 oxidase